MRQASKIVSVTARQIMSLRGHPGIEATVETQNGARGVAIVTAGISVGKHEVRFATGGEDLYGPAGVQMAVDNVNNVIGPAIMGMDASVQAAVDSVIIDLDGTPDKSKLGGNATASVSAALLKAGAASTGVPLYQHIGGVRALTLPVPGVPAYSGSRRYGYGAGSGAKPSVSFICFGFDSFSEAVAGGWKVSREFRRLMFDRLKVDMRAAQWNLVSPGVVTDDRQLWARDEGSHRRGGAHRSCGHPDGRGLGHLLPMPPPSATWACSPRAPRPVTT